MPHVHREGLELARPALAASAEPAEVDHQKRTMVPSCRGTAYFLLSAYDDNGERIADTEMVVYVRDAEDHGTGTVLVTAALAAANLAGGFPIIRALSYPLSLHRVSLGKFEASLF